MLNYQMRTPQASDFNPEKPLEEYPRPYLVRDSYINLNGIWDCEIVKSKKIPNEFTKKIVVPYPIESCLSGLRLDLKKNDILVYRKVFSVEKEFIKDKVILHFGAVNQVCEIYLNGSYILHHKGGYSPFKIDITQFLHNNDNELVVFVKNTPNLNYWVGKAGKKRGGMWYTKTTGIWQTVWMESYYSDAVENVHFQTSLNGNVKAKVKSKADSFDVCVSFNGDKVLELNNVGKDFEFNVENPHLWDLDNPNLYDVTISCKNDQIKTYFAFREFKTLDKKFVLNGKPIFINGLLDQGYFSDGIYTPASYTSYEYDIVKMKELGFNALRKHIKVEPQMFYYLADKLGMLILQDFPNSGKYSFIRDTVFPTIGINKISDKKKHVSKERKEHFIECGLEMMNNLYPHPSVVYYTIFNEGWGQFHSDEMYHFFKQKDPSRVYDSTSGWFHQNDSDCNSIHIYFRNVTLPEEEKRPIMLSEFGGYSWKVVEHSFNSKNNYGYRLFDSKEALTEALITLYNRDVIDLIPQGLAGCIYTQVSDVEDETNGILTYDRQMVKVDEDKIKELMKKVKY